MEVVGAREPFKTRLVGGTRRAEADECGGTRRFEAGEDKEGGARRDEGWRGGRGGGGMEVGVGCKDFCRVGFLVSDRADDTFDVCFVGVTGDTSVGSGELSFKDIVGVAESFRLFGDITSALEFGVDLLTRREGMDPSCSTLIEMSPSSLSELPSLRGWLLPSSSDLMPSVVTSELFRRHDPSKENHDAGEVR